MHGCDSLTSTIEEIGILLFCGVRKRVYCENRGFPMRLIDNSI
jgi:hypothetical protein